MHSGRGVRYTKKDIKTYQNAQQARHHVDYPTNITHRKAAKLVHESTTCDIPIRTIYG